MKVKCDYCGQLIDENQNYCPNCGASMPTANRTASGQPKTIEELKQWYTAHNLPPENVTRFYIGKDYRHPKAFGIYKATDGDFVVYKNKADGKRAIRYKGKDEEYAVNELYQKLKIEIAEQKARSAATRTTRQPLQTSRSNDKESILTLILKNLLFTRFGWAFIIVLIVSGIAYFDHSPEKGYYQYNRNNYFYNGSWYVYDPSYYYWSYIEDDFLDDIIYDDTAEEYRTYDPPIHYFDKSTLYDSYDSFSSDYDYSYDWDSDYSWDSSDSWDSDYSSWDSDW